MAAPGLVVLQPGRGDRLAPQRVHHVRLQAVVLEQGSQPPPPVRGLERHRRPGRQRADQPPHRLTAIDHVPVDRHLAVLADNRDLRTLAMNIDSDVNRHHRVSFPSSI